MHKKKGIALFLVLFTSLILFIVVIGLLYILGANLRQLETYDERTRAYYLCETAASVAILDIRNDKIDIGPGQSTERTVNVVLDGNTYPVQYTVSRDNQGEWVIISKITAGASFKRNYNSRVGGRRAFPIFIKGFGGR